MGSNQMFVFQLSSVRIDIFVMSRVGIRRKC